MDVRQSIKRTGGALAAVLAFAGPLTASAQGPREVPEPYTPAADAKDLKSVLFNWTRNQGMLKGHDERDMVASLEYQGTGTIQVDGQPCTLTKYRASTNYQSFSQRIQYECKKANGQSVLEHRGRERTLRLGRRQARCGDRRHEGQGQADAVGRPGAADPDLGEPAGRAEGRDRGDDRYVLCSAPIRARCSTTATTKVGQTSVAWEGGKPVVTFPLPGVPGATATATLDAKFMTERVVVKQGSTTTRVQLQRLQGLEQPAEPHRRVLCRQVDRAHATARSSATSRRSRPRRATSTSWRRCPRA